MTKKLFLKTFLPVQLMLLCFSFSKSSASHMAGAELIYTWLSDSTYQFTYIFYKDCSGSAEPNSVIMCIKNSCTSFNTSITLPKLTLLPNGGSNGGSVSTGCPGNPTSCSGGSIIGYKEWWYQTTFTLPSRCSNWNFGITVNARNAAITNLDAPGTAQLYTEATLNNVISQTNSSPKFSIKPVPYVCVNQPFSFNNGTVEVNGDSLVFESIAPRKKPTGSCSTAVSNVTYSNTLFNINNPFDCNNTFNCNPSTGEITFTAASNQVAVVAIRCKEYKNGVLVGSVMRDIQMVISSCTAPVPTQNVLPSSVIGASFDSISGGLIIPCFSATPISFCFNVQSNNPSAVIVSTANNASSLPGSTITYTGLYTDSVVGCLTWQPTLADSGLNLLVINIKDSACSTGSLFIINTSITIPIFIGQSVDIGNLTVNTVSSCSNPNSGFASVVASSSSNPIYYSIQPTGANNNTGIFNNLSVGTYTLAVSDNKSCTKTATFDIVFLDVPSFVSATTIPNITCTDSVGKIIIAATGNLQPFTYLLSNGTSNLSGVFNNVLPGTYTVTVTNTLGCSNTTIIILGYNPANVANISTTILPASGSICNGQSVTLTATGATTITWFGGVLNGVSFSPSASTIYTVVGANAGGCSKSKLVSIIVNPIVIPNFTSSSIACKGSIIPPLPTISLNGITGSWSPAINNLVTTSYTFTPASGQCANTISQSIIVNSPTITTITTTNTICSNANGSIVIGAISGGIPPYQYNINNGNFGAINTFNNLLATTYSIIVKDANGCTYQSTIVITDKAGPSSIATSINNATCSNANGKIVINNVTNGTVPYLYNINNNGYIASNTFNNLQAGTYTITIKDSNGCTFSKPETIINLAGPTNIIANVSNTYCSISNGIININNVAGGTLPLQYAFNNNFSANNIFNNIAIGTYTIIAKDANNCSISSVVSIVDEPGPSSISALVSHTFCNGNNGIIECNVAGGTAPITFKTNISGFIASPNFLNMGAGTYTITAKDDNGCTITTVAVVKPSLGVTSVDVAIKNVTCDGQNGSILLTNPLGGALPYLYIYNNNAPTNINYYANLIAGNYSVAVVDADGCTLQKIIEIQNKPEIVNFIIEAKTASCIADDGEVSVKLLEGGSAPFTYTLLPNNISNNTGKFINLKGNQSYTVIALDVESCSISSTVKLSKIECCTGVYVPNAFSPNGDGINDEFKILFSENLVLNNYRIANRNGEIIFSSNNKEAIWRGDFKGGKCDIGVYFYYINYYCPITNQDIIKQGEVTIVR